MVMEPAGRTDPAAGGGSAGSQLPQVCLCLVFNLFVYAHTCATHNTVLLDPRIQCVDGHRVLG